MALRRGAAGLLPRLFATSAEVRGSICSSSHSVLGLGTPSSSEEQSNFFWGSFRCYASELAAIKSGSTNACDKLSVSPTSHIMYDESNHKRYAPGVVEKSPAVMVQAAGRFFYATAARLAALKFILSMSAAADVLALASLEVDMTGIEEGQTVTVKWRGKPVFIRHRTPEEINEANDIDMAQLRDPQTDTERVVDPKYLVVVGVCTHLGCVPISGAGDYNGWFCPCHGSHYDISGRIRKGPAPYNLEVPEYKFIEGGAKAIIG